MMDKNVSNYLADLEIQQTNLANNLVVKGVQADKNELLNTLVPKVLQINEIDSEIETEIETETVEKGDIRVRFFYRDITTGRIIIVSKFYNKGENATYPTNVGNVPEILDSFGNLQNSAFIFQGWDSTQEQLNNLQKNVDVGAIYKTEDGWTYFILNITNNTTGNISFYFNKSDNSILTLDTGDGSPVKISNAVGNINYSHIYTQLNRIYIAKVKITEGTGTFLFGNGTAGTVVIGGGSIPARQSLIKCFIGEGVTNIGTYAFYDCDNLEDITIPNEVTKINDYAFSDCVGLKTVVLPSAITNVANYVFRRNYNLRNVVISKEATFIGNSAFF